MVCLMVLAMAFRGPFGYAVSRLAASACNQVAVKLARGHYDHEQACENRQQAQIE